MTYIVIVWDDRDTEATEPSSELGRYYSLERAESALHKYLSGEHGKHIYRHRIECED